MAENPLSELTERELEILHFAAEGYTSEEIAARFHLSEQTIKFHLANVYIKLKVDNRVKAAVTYHIWCAEPY